MHPTLPLSQEDTMLLDLVYRLTQAGEPFVLATVVWCERPTSAKPGAQAVIQADGQITGWIGGSCAQPVVLREAARALREHCDPFLLRLGAPEMGIERQGIHIFPMTCTSGGALDIYMEPHFPQPKLLLIGDSPIIVALGRMASIANFSITQLASADLSQQQVNEQTYILVATHGQYDEEALEQALHSPAKYVGMVGSRKRGEACRQYLRGSGLTEQQLARLRVPAGLDIGAVMPEEIAASILAELVQVRRCGLPDLTESSLSTHQEQSVEVVPAVPDTAIDPVCGMMVETVTARHHSAYNGQEYYFCCPACKRLFERNPQEYLMQYER